MVRVEQGATKTTQVKSKQVVSKPERTPESHPHQCSTCGARFKQKEHLINHELTHSGSKPHKCSECPLSFAQKGTLDRHNLVHSKVKPHKCSECSKSFARKDDLNRHLINTHSLTKEFSCPDCPKKFKSTSGLLRHTNKHHKTGKEYSCSKCPKNFARRAYMNKHLKSHGILLPYSCSIPTCDESFRLQRELLLHEATHKTKGDKSTTISKSSSTKTKPKKRVSFNIVSDTEESQDEKSTKKKQNRQVRKRAKFTENDENIENEPPAKKRKMKHAKNNNNNNNDENEEEEEKYEFFTSKPYWCFCGKCFATKEIFTHHQDNEESGKHFLQLHECPLCPETGPEPEVFETFEEFEDHYSSFHQLLIHECPLCGDKYATIQELEDHLDKVDPFLFL